MEKRRIKYIVLAFISLAIGILLANLFKNYFKFSIYEYILSYMGLMLLMLVPYLLLRSKPSKYFVLSLIFFSVAYTIIIILIVFHSNLPNYFEEMGVLIFGIFMVLAAIFSIITATSSFKKFIRLFKSKD